MTQVTNGNLLCVKIADIVSTFSDQSALCLCVCGSGSVVFKRRLFDLWSYHFHSGTCQSVAAGDTQQADGRNCRRH